MKSENPTTVNEALLDSPEFKETYRIHELRERIHAGKVGSALVVFLMPAGVTLDFFVYRDRVPEFFALRLACSVVAAMMWFLYTKSFGQKHHRLLGMAIVLSPAFFIDWMIWATEGTVSPYYAGLNLILLALNVVLHWSILESFITVGLITLMYLAACFLKPGALANFGIFFNNLYFLTLTGIIVITGNYFFNKLRFREFALRYELDKNRRMLEQTNEKLVELGQVKDRFFANISHELRTPLTLLLSPLETMLHQRGGSFDGETKSLFGIMHANGMRLLKLINDLLDLVRLESGRLEVKREPMEMTAFIRNIASAAQQMAENKGIKLEISVEPDFGAVLVDRDKLEKVILNLIFNALKFTPKDGRVELRVAREGKDFLLTVTDTGIGIAQKNLPFVFDRFWQADGSSKRKFQGVGIGLSLVKELTEIHGGKVSVESEEGKGTKFTVRIPYLPADSAAQVEPLQIQTAHEQIPSAPSNEVSAPQSEEWLANLYRRAEFFPATATQEVEATEISHNGNNPNILIADDEPDMLRFLKSQLKNKFQVTEAIDGKEAVEKALENIPDIILVDMNMPEKDGLQVCRELREKSATRNIPIIMLTARGDEQTKLTALSAGANDFLTKPFSTTELHVRIKNLLDAHDYQEKLADKNKLLEQTIEQLKQTEMQLVQTEKMASMGRMSAGIIHEINNPLNYAATGLYTLRNKGKFLAAEQQAQYAEVLKDVEEGISRVKNIVLDLRKFTHPDTGHSEAIEILQVVNSALRFTGNEWKDRVHIELNVPERQVVFGNTNRLLQVFINLLQNSLDALKGKIFDADTKPTIWISGKMDENTSIITLRDNGNGIPEAAMNKIFDPFFTTKDVGEGMGLGLSICYQIMQENNGTISVASEPGKFAEFTLEFPAKR
ncbi:MAG: ATP-binding protein [Verrucomicrobiota bacterium]